jgi:hypothetical protein
VFPRDNTRRCAPLKKRCLQRKRFDELKNARQNKAKVWNIVRTLNKRPSQRCEIKPDTLFEHFSTLLSNAPILNDQFNDIVTDTLYIHDSECNMCLSNEPNLTLDEIAQVINNLPNNKSPGVDGLVYEMYKHASHILLQPLCILFNTILCSGQYPDSWCEAIISPIHKKGFTKRPIQLSLLCTISKIFMKILNNRMTTWAEENGKLDEGQSAYRKHRSTVDNMFTLYATVQKYLSKKSGRCYCVYVDFTQAFDTIPHLHLWFKLIRKGVHGKILVLLRKMYAKLKSCVKTISGLTEFFECTIGTRQGCMISPFLFILYIDELVDMLQNSGCSGVFINSQVPSLHIIMFADDVTILNDTIGRVQAQLNVLQQFSRNYGLKVNINKTKLMVFRNGGPLRRNEKLYFNGLLVESVTYYKYLGLIFSSRLSWSKTIKTLRQQAEKAIIAVKIICNKCGELPFNIAFHLFDTLVLPILCYGSEIWGYQINADIEIVHRSYCKYILGTSSHTPNAAA